MPKRLAVLVIHVRKWGRPIHVGPSDTCRSDPVRSAPRRRRARTCRTATPTSSTVDPLLLIRPFRKPGGGPSTRPLPCESGIEALLGTACLRAPAGRAGPGPLTGSVPLASLVESCARANAGANFRGCGRASLRSWWRRASSVACSSVQSGRLPRKNVPGPSAPVATVSIPRRRKPVRSVRSGVWNGVFSPRLLTTTT